MLKTLRDCFDLNWEIQWEGINVADQAAGAGGDVTVTRDGAIVLAIEVTERGIDRTRVVSTFNAKISPYGIDDYLFFFSAVAPTEDARESTRQYFAQGHDINFVSLDDWLINLLSTIGPRCRNIFTNKLIELLERLDVPVDIKVAWNDHIRDLFSRQVPPTH